MFINKLNNLIIWKAIVPKVIRTLIWKFLLRKKILQSFKNNKDKGIKKITDFLDKNPLEIFPYNFIFNYKENDIEVYFDDDKNLKYTYLFSKKLYFPKRWSKSRIRKSLNQLLIEQDLQSPHRYLTDTFNINENSIVVDIGCAEANFSLEIIEKVKHIYLFEANDKWIIPLKTTFEKYKEKVTIVNKKLSNYDSENTVNADRFFKEKKINFLKIDVDGNEKEVMSGLSNIIENSKQMQVALCTYHSQNDYNKYSDYFKKNNYYVEHSNGYTVFYWDKNLSYPFLRRGLIRATHKLEVDELEENISMV